MTKGTGMSAATNAPTDPNDPLTYFWRRPVEDVATVVNTAISPGDAERHKILSLLVMALVSDAFNGNKHGETGNYPWRKGQFINGRYAGNSYLGHNIGCVAVDATGALMDFEFNHNEIFNSSVEHAEARLVRRIFNLNQNYDHWQTIDPKQLQDVSYPTTLSAVTIYTSLESCAQCSGIMTLGNVKSVVFLQSDRGQYRIGNILYNLSNPVALTHPGGATTQLPTKYGAPEPINADIFGFKYKAQLDAAYQNYVQTVTANPKTQYFYQPPGGGVIDASSSITSFLCCDPAKAIFDAAAAELDSLTLQLPAFTPTASGATTKPLTNAESLQQARSFRHYVATAGRRGTPHK
jgi:tRNA(Arg) A34 adenosine deaminase TadA